MRNRSLLLCCFVLFAGVAAAGQDAPPSADPAEAVKLSAEVTRLYNAGQYDEALTRAKQLLEIREKALGGAHLLVGHAVGNLGVIYRARQQYADAERAFKRALAIYENSWSGDSPNLCPTLEHLAWVEYAIGQASAAKKHLLRSLEIREKASGESGKEMVQTLSFLGQLHEKQGQYKDAFVFYKRAFDVAEKAWGPKDAQLAVIAEKCSCTLKLDKQPMLAAGYDMRVYAIRYGNETGTKRLPGGRLSGTAIFRQEPEYPAAAKQQRISGSVVVEVTVDENGNVVAARTLCGHDFFARVSEEAARKWRFTPTRVNGEPVKVKGTITFNFNL